MTSLDLPTGVSSAVLKASDPVPEGAISVQGPNFDKPLDLQQFISSYERIGFQANSLAKAIHIINNMVCTL
jgi:deoxyhypusine synthase